MSLMRRRSFLLFAAISFSCGLSAAFLLMSKPIPPVAHSTDPLDQVLPQVDLQDTSYSAAIDYLRNLSHANLIADWDQLSELEITPQTPLRIDLHLRDVTLGQVLHCIVASYEEPHPTFDVYKWSGVRVQGNLIFFTVEHFASDDDPKVTRGYEVGDLLEHADRWTVAELPNAETHERQWSHRSPAQRLSLLIDAKINPGPGPDSRGPIRLFYHTLLVTQTPENHRDVAKVLQCLRDIVNGKVPREEND